MGMKAKEVLALFAQNLESTVKVVVVPKDREVPHLAKPILACEYLEIVRIVHPTSKNRKIVLEAAYMEVPPEGTHIYCFENECIHRSKEGRCLNPEIRLNHDHSPTLGRMVCMEAKIEGNSC